MSRLSTAEFVARTLIVIGLLALAAISWRVAEIFVLIFGGVVLAVVLRSMMHLCLRFTPLRGRWALLAGIVLLLVIIALIALLIGSRVASQMSQLTQALPRDWAHARASIEQTSTGRQLLQNLQSSSSQANLSSWLAHLHDLATITLGALVQLGVILFTGLYFALDPDMYRRGLLLLLPLNARPHADRAINAAIAGLGRWLQGVLIAMVSIGVVTGMGLWALGIPLALALGILGGVLEFIPYIGPIISAVPAVLIAFAVSPTRALEVVALYVGIHLIEGELLVPLIQRWAVALPPAVAIVAVVVFGWIFGLPGVIFATPMAVVLIKLVENLYVRTALKSS
ncbi:MAG TPA: AI-2E family transporter [Steroidobacteraceae bacterium]|nr:AI-2E family transporter [Steroidobacteraceae bacterium]